MKIIGVAVIFIFLGCSKNVGKYVSYYNYAGTSFEFLKYNKFIKRVGQCGGGVEISKGNYFVKNKRITFIYEKIDDHFTYQLIKKKDDPLRLSVKVMVQDTSHNAIPFLTSRLFDGDRLIDGGYTDTIGKCNIGRNIIIGQAQIQISGLHYSNAYIDLPKTGYFELNVIFSEKTKELQDYVWNLPETYKLVKFTKDSLILKSMESDYEMRYIKKDE